MSTSGDAEQWVEIGGVRYSHIFDPRTGWPLTGRRQATVVARDATTSDMLATTLCVLGQDGLRLADGTPGAAAMIAVPDRLGERAVGVLAAVGRCTPGLKSRRAHSIFDTGGLMRRFVLGVLLAAAAAASLTAAGEQNTLTTAETADGWKLLFDGKTTIGMARLEAGIGARRLEGRRMER